MSGAGFFTAMGVTYQQVKSLLHEAAGAGDDALASMCARAMDGDTIAWAECARVIREGAAKEGV